MASTSQCSAGFDKRSKRRSGGIFGEGGTVWEMAATSSHNDFHLDFEERHERSACCACVYGDPLVGSSEGAGGGKMAIQISC